MSDTAKARGAAEELREAIAEAHGLAKDLRALIKDAREVFKNTVAEHLERAVEEGLEDYKTTLAAAIEEADAAVHRRFEELTNTLLTGNRRGRGPTLVDEALAHRPNPNE